MKAKCQHYVSMFGGGECGAEAVQVFCAWAESDEDGPYLSAVPVCLEHYRYAKERRDMVIVLDFPLSMSLCDHVEEER